MLWELFITFFKIGLFTFGGGYAMIPLIKQEVFAHGWISEDILYNFIGIAESTPGPIAINMAVFIGSSQGGILGALLATLGVVLPSFIIILIIAALFTRFLQNRIVRGVLKGVKPVIVGLILCSGIDILLKVLFVNFSINSTLILNYRSLIMVVILGAVVILYKTIRKKQFSSILLILISIVLGIVMYAI